MTTPRVRNSTGPVPELLDIYSTFYSERHLGGRLVLVKVDLDPKELLVVFLSIPGVSRHSAGLFVLIFTIDCKTLGQLS
jgi:hypothetical protein